MSELINFTALRSPDVLSQNKIDKAGIQTHPDKLLSERYRNWRLRCERKEHQLLYTEMEEFLRSKAAIKTFKQMPAHLAAVVKFAAYNEFTGFDIETFAKQIDLRKVSNEFGKSVKEDGTYEEKSPFFNLLTNLNDQLLADTQIDITIKREFDLQGAIKTLKLAEAVYLVGKEKIRLNVDKHYAKPLIIQSCILEIDLCDLRVGKPVPLPVPGRIGKVESNINKETNDNSKKEKECRCEEKGHEDCECKCSDECVDQNPCCVTIEPYVAELFVVRDEVCKYEPGDISYIKNIIKGESQERIHRDFAKEITESETEEETKKYEEKFLEVTDKSNIKKTIEDIIKDETKVHVGVHYGKGTKEKPKGLFIEGTFDFKRNRTRTNKIIQDKTKDIVSELTSRLERNTTVTNSLTLHKETEITNISRLGGLNTDISRQLCSVNQTRKAQVYSYGMRTMLDFCIPEPSELLKRLVEKQFTHKKPEKPCINIEDIGTTKEDWLEYVQCYGFTDLEMPPARPPVKWETIFIDENTENPFVNIDQGYTATEMHMPESNMHKRTLGFHRFTLSFGGGTVERSYKASRNPQTVINTPISLTPTKISGPISIDKVNIKDFWAVIKIKLVPEPVNYLPWQLEVHKLLMEKYKSELAEYMRALAEFEKQKEDYFNKNPLILSEMMKTQLKQAAISYITCQFFEDNDALKGKVKGCGFPQMDLRETKKEGAFVRFFEQAFEWSFMNYMLYPYFWGRKCAWEDKLRQESNDYLFALFLKAGFARITVSIRPGFEEMVNYYLQTRQIWNGGQPPVLGNGLPIHQEIVESRNNYNADREGYLQWNNSLDKNEILLYNNLDYYTEDIDPVTGNPIGTYSFDPDKAKIDLNREVNINCITYRILSINEVDATNNVVKLTLDRDLEVDCCCNGSGKEFEEIYDKRELPWSTGALFIGAPWKYTIPTSLVWLREKGGCLPCYPIECE